MDTIINGEETSENIIDDANLSDLSYSSYDSIDNKKMNLMVQITCDECDEIPKIICTDIVKKTILFKCKNHGLKNLDIKEYVSNSQNYNSNNWKCSKCKNIQREQIKDKFKYCECGSVFCLSCYKLHLVELENNKKPKHEFSLDSDKFDLNCKEKPSHFNNIYKGYCFECNKNFCNECEIEHKNHNTIQNNKLEIDSKDINKIKEINKEYRSLITYYESLIRLNNLIIYAYENFRGNYYNAYNINIALNNYQRNKYIDILNKKDSKIMLPGVDDSNLYNYMNNLYIKKEALNEDTAIEIKIDNKFFNNYDLKILTQIPLKNLRILELDNNAISNIEYLKYANFTDLVILSLKNNAIKDISVFKDVKFKEIQGLLLSNNNIEDIKPIGDAGFGQIRLIDLKNNEIQDILIFEKPGFPNLQCIYLSGNKIDYNKYKSIKSILDKCDEHTY